ncbi:sulfate permease [Thozetella sp. PMI_491]|nr:sulfate permease [Thozetella sp. PMI_491]
MAKSRFPSLSGCKEAVLDDDNVQRFVAWCRSCRRSTGRGTVRYLTEKVPIVRWLPHYAPTWLVNDTVAGLTIGVLLVPQSLAYAEIARLPGAYGLLSSWLPMLIYAIMGTSKDTQTAPTAIGSLLTGSIIISLRDEGYSPPDIATAVSFMCGIYGLAVGLFKLGFLLDFISAPVLAGYVSAAGLTICLQQVPNFLALGNAGHETTEIIYHVFSRLPQVQWRDFTIGITSLLALAGLQYVGKRWGKAHPVFWFLSISRNALVIILYTGISYGLNKNIADHPLFGISKTTGTLIGPPSMPPESLLSKVTGGALTVFIAAALEHLAIGKAFGRRHGYTIDQSQELLYIGATNFVGSFFSSMPVTGGFSRTAVNSESGVKSPLGGLVSSACVLVSVYKLAGVLFWIPKATLSAVIISAVWAIIVPPRIFYQYWRTSFADFVASMISFWVTLFVSVETGIAAAVGYNILYLLFRLAFTGVTPVSSLVSRTMHADLPDGTHVPDEGLDSTQRFRVGESVLFANAYRIKDEILSHVKTATRGIPMVRTTKPTDRLWNQIPTKTDSFSDPESNADGRPLLGRVVLDMTAVSHIDTTGIQALLDLKGELRDYAGHSAMVFVGMNEGVRRRFEKANWNLHKASDLDAATSDLVFGYLDAASSSFLFKSSDTVVAKMQEGPVTHVETA